MKAGLCEKTLMSEFLTYFEVGIRHILDINGYDHILFIIALCAIYLVKEWKKLLILITAFTIGHSLTLALSVLDYVLLEPAIIEFLIPVTIFITAVFNFFHKNNFSFETTRNKRSTFDKSESGGSFQTNEINKSSLEDNTRSENYRYFFALFFGLIHGLGFSNYLKSLVSRDENIISQLFAFNVGLEAGQLVIVTLFLIASYVLVDLLKVNKRDWNLVISGIVAGFSLDMIIEKNIF